MGCFSVKIGKAVDSSYEGQKAVVRVYNRYLTAAEIFKDLVINDDLANFLTLKAYDKLIEVLL